MPRRRRRYRRPSKAEPILYLIFSLSFLFVVYDGVGFLNSLNIALSDLFVIGASSLAIGIFVLFLWRFSKEVNRNIEKNLRFQHLRNVSQVDLMDHYLFEQFAGYVLEHSGFTNVDVTKRTGDGGIDIYADRNKKKVAVQIKHWRVGNNVGRDDLQKLIGAYLGNADEAWCITTSDFTAHAKEYALSHPNLKLVNRVEFGGMIDSMGTDWMQDYIIKPLIRKS